MTRKGPFGLWMGMTAEDFGAPLVEIAPCMFIVPTVPKPHSAFDQYVGQITPKLGLSWIKAIGKTIDTSGYGVELKSAFDSMEQKLATTYGMQKRNDFLMHDSIWSEPRDWMQAVLSKERILMSEWSRDTGAALTDSLMSVALIAGAYDASTGYITIEYSFEDSAKANMEVAAMEDDAL